MRSGSIPECIALQWLLYSVKYVVCQFASDADGVKLLTCQFAGDAEGVELLT